MVKTARAAGIQLIEVRRRLKGIGFLKRRARRFTVRVAPTFQGR